MLDKKTIALVKSTAPFLEEHGVVLTQHFYKRMFLQNPEVLPLFNSAHQQTGTQQKALAGAICSYVANIDNLGALENAMELIAQKHSSLQIKPEHYPIVGDNLIASIQEVLQERATKEVVDAWKEAYIFLSNMMTKREEQIYHEHSMTPGGWTGFKTFRVIKKERESKIITSFYLSPEDGIKPPLFKPGQYITLCMQGPYGYSTMRNYSLSNQPGQNWFRISVKRESGKNATTPAGYVSNFLHDHIDVNSKLHVGPPCGDFFLDTTEKQTRPLVLLAAGVGITPLLSILLSALNEMPNRKIILIHGSLNEETQAFKNEIDKLKSQHSNLTVHYCYSELAAEGYVRDNCTTTGFINANLIESMIPDRDADYYFCGPQPFMTTIYSELQEWEIPSTQVHFEFFGPRQELESLVKV